MAQQRNEYFGGPLFGYVQAKSDLLWPLLKDDPRYCFHGRAVGLDGGQAVELTLIVSLAKLVGVALCDFVPTSEADKLQLSLEELGFSTDRMEMWTSGQATIKTAREIIASKSLLASDDIAFVTVDTSSSDLKALDEFTQKHGTSLPMESFIRGTQKPAVCVYARESDGQIFVTAASVGHFHDSHARSDMAYWGMLATREDRRGQGAALLMGAHAVVAMHERHGFKRFFTPIKKGILRVLRKPNLMA
jgi:hypothetical protein